MAAGDIIVSGFTGDYTVLNQIFTYKGNEVWEYNITGEVVYVTGHWEINKLGKNAGLWGYLVTGNDDDPEGDFSPEPPATGDPKIEWWVGTPTDPGYADLVALFKMNDSGSSAVKDDSADPNNGVFYDDESPATVVSDTGLINEALVFAGVHERVEIPDAVKYNETGNISVGIFFNADTFTEHDGLLSKQNSDGVNHKEWNFAISDPSGSDACVRVQFGDPSLGTHEGAFRTDARVVSTGGWHLALFTFAANECIIYVDGKRKASQVIGGAVPASLFNGPAPLRIAKMSDLAVTCFDGLLDCGFMFTKTLTPEEVAWVWNSGTGREDFGPPVVVRVLPIVMQQMNQFKGGQNL